MSFQIIEYLNIISEISTEWTTTCPSCGGKLKVKKDNNAYLCVTQKCPTNKIRKSLGLKCREAIFIQTKYITPISLENRNFAAVPDDYEPKYTVENNETLYVYNPHFSVKRVDLAKKKKAFYPYFRINNEWVKSSEVPAEDKLLLSSFYYEYLVEPQDIVLITEGEKCTDFILENFKLKCITPSGFGWSEKWLKYHLAKLNLGGILIIPDHDKAGIEKAMLLQRVAWTLDIPCNIKFLYPYLGEEKDIADISDSEKTKILESILLN